MKNEKAAQLLLAMDEKLRIAYLAGLATAFYEPLYAGRFLDLARVLTDSDEEDWEAGIKRDVARMIESFSLEDEE